MKVWGVQIHCIRHSILRDICDSSLRVDFCVHAWLAWEANIPGDGEMGSKAHLVWCWLAFE